MGKMGRIKQERKEGESKIWRCCLFFEFPGEEKKTCTVPGRGRSDRNKPLGHMVDLSLGCPS